MIDRNVPREVPSRAPDLGERGVILVNRFRENPLVVMIDAPRSAAAEEFRKVVVGGSGRDAG